MTQSPSLKKNFAWTLSGKVIYGFAQWATLVVLAKLGSPEVVGRFALALALTAPIVMFANLNLQRVLATDAADKYSFGEYLGLRLSTLAAAFAAIVVVAVSGGRTWDVVCVVLAVGAAKCFESVTDLFLALMQKNERMDRVALSMHVKSAVTLAFFTASLWLTRSLPWGTAFLALAWLLTLLFFDRRNARNCVGPSVSFKPQWSAPRLRSLALLALPLGVSALLGSLFINVPRYFIGSMLGERELGIFAAMAYVSVAGARVVMALGDSAVPRLARRYKDGDADGYSLLLLQISGVGLLLGAAGVAGAALLGRPILTLLYRREYAAHLDVFILLMTASGIGYVSSFLEYGITAARLFWPSPVITGLGSVIMASGCLLLIPRLGLAGAGWANVAAACSTVTCRLLVTWWIRRKMLGGRA